jgi:hypothetical protein
MTVVSSILARLEGLRLKERFEAFSAKSSPRIMSSRLWMTVAAAIAGTWLLRDQVGLIVTLLTTLTVVFLACRTITDVATMIMDGMIKMKIIGVLGKDGKLDAGDQAVINAGQQPAA